jgi:methyltransferase (TIGR00027 family)
MPSSAFSCSGSFVSAEGATEGAALDAVVLEGAAGTSLADDAVLGAAGASAELEGATDADAAGMSSSNPLCAAPRCAKRRSGSIKSTHQASRAAFRIGPKVEGRWTRTPARSRAARASEESSVHMHCAGAPRKVSIDASQSCVHRRDAAPILGRVREGPSITAAWVAAHRTLGTKLPPEAQLADDPYGAAFGGRGVALLARYYPRALSLPLWPMTIYMQVRTRAIDDVLRAFVAAGGTQVLILGAGYDCRAARFAGELAGARVFEVDHPSTQSRKRAVLQNGNAPSAPVTYVAWDFERRPVGQLPDALASLGHDRSARTLTIWEGVTMYLTPEAIESTVSAVHALSAPGSPFVFNYFERERLERPSRGRALVANVVARIGEPFRFGWRPEELPAWFSARGFELEWNREMLELARSYLPPRFARLIRKQESWIAVVRRAAGGDHVS